MSQRQPGPLCVTQVGVNWIDEGTMCRSRSMSPVPTGFGLSQHSPDPLPYRPLQDAHTASELKKDEYSVALAAYNDERDPKRRGNLFAKLVLSSLTACYGVEFEFTPEVDMGSGTRFDALGYKNGRLIIVEIKDVAQLSDLWLGKGLSRTQLPTQVEMVLSNGGLYELIVSPRTTIGFIVEQLKDLEERVALRWRLSAYDCRTRRFTVKHESSGARLVA